MARSSTTHKTYVMSGGGDRSSRSLTTAYDKSRGRSWEFLVEFEDGARWLRGRRPGVRLPSEPCFKGAYTYPIESLYSSFPKSPSSVPPFVSLTSPPATTCHGPAL